MLVEVVSLPHPPVSTHSPKILQDNKSPQHSRRGATCPRIMQQSWNLLGLWTLRTLVRAVEQATYSPRLAPCIGDPPVLSPPRAPHPLPPSPQERTSGPATPSLSPALCRPSSQLSSLYAQPRQDLPPTSVSQGRVPTSTFPGPSPGPHPSFVPRVENREPSAFRPWCPRSSYEQPRPIYLGPVPD